MLLQIEAVSTNLNVHFLINPEKIYEKENIKYKFSLTIVEK